jgi:hypothetical protein
VIEPPDLKLLDSAAKDALILALIERVNDLIAENAKLKERLARLAAEPGAHGVGRSVEHAKRQAPQGHEP